MKANSVSEGLYKLLVESIQILNRLKEEYIIIGGWSPLLLNSRDPILHPGTKDVDVLLKKGYKKDSLRDLFLAFISEGFFFSAKNDFQLIKTIEVNGSQFAYNVDFLHPIMDNSKEIYIDQLDLGIPIDEYRSSTFMLKSIATPNSMVLFEGYYELYDLEWEGQRYSFPLVNEAGLLVTKSESVKTRKRTRDSLDVFMAIKNARNRSSMISDLLRLRKDNSSAYNSLYGIRQTYTEGDFVKNVLKYYSDNVDIAKTMEAFFHDSMIDKEAENL